MRLELNQHRINGEVTAPWAHQCPAHPCIWWSRLDSNQCAVKNGFTVRRFQPLTHSSLNISHTLSNVYDKANYPAMLRFSIQSRVVRLFALSSRFLPLAFSPLASHPRGRPLLQHVLSALSGLRSQRLSPFALACQRAYDGALQDFFLTKPVYLAFLSDFSLINCNSCSGVIE